MLAPNEQPRGVLCSILEAWSRPAQPACQQGCLTDAFNRHVGELAGQVFTPKCT